MTLLSPQLDMIITIVVTLFIVLLLAIPIKLSMRKSYHAIVFGFIAFLLMAFLILGEFLKLDSFIVYFSLSLMVGLIIISIIDKRKVKHIWFTLSILSFSIMIGLIKYELLFLLDLILTFIIFIITTYISYIEVKEDQLQERYILFLSILEAIILAVPFAILIFYLPHDNISLVKNIDSTNYKTIIYFPLLIVFAIILAIPILQKLFSSLERSKEELWYQ